MNSDIQKERTIVLIKPDGVQRGLVGDIITRLEKMGLKLVGMKLVHVEKDFAEQHYPASRTELMTAIGSKTLDTYNKYGRDPKEEFGTIDPVEIGKMVNKWNIEFITSGTVVAILLEGVHAVEVVRQLIGSTLPYQAAPGTIRGDYSIDSPALANIKRRSVKNLVHASGNVEEAKYEEQLWFKQQDIVDNYKRSDEAVMFD